MDARATLVVPGSPAGIRQAVEGFESFAADQQLPPAGVWPFQVAIDEVLSNIVKYGLEGSGAERRIEIELRLALGALEVAIVDDGPAFNPLEVAEADTSRPLEERPIGGLGLTLLRKLMTSVAYERREGRNRLVFARRIDPGAPAAT